MKIKPLLNVLLMMALGTLAQTAHAQSIAEIEPLSASVARELPQLSLDISLEKTSFYHGEPIAVTFTYRNEGELPVSFRRSGTNYSPLSSVRREFRARQLDGDVLLQSQTQNIGLISEMTQTQIIAKGQSVSEKVFLNERFLLERVGLYQLTAWSNAVYLNNQTKWLQSNLIELRIIPTTEGFKTQVLNESQAKIDAALTLTRGRSSASYPPEITFASQAAKKLGWLQDERAIPILVAALEIGNNSYFEAQKALQSYPRDKVENVVRQRLEKLEPLSTSRQIWLEFADYSPAEKQEIEAQLDERLRDALNETPDRQKRGFLATRGLMDSRMLRKDSKFWHEALTNLAIENQNPGFDLYALLNNPFLKDKIALEPYPIETADLKAALESKAPLQVRMQMFQMLRERDSAYLREFLLAQVDELSFDYARGVFGIFSDAQLKPVVAKLIVRIQSPEFGSDSAHRDGLGRKLRDMALRGVTIEQLEKLEGWLLQNAPAADAPILDAIELKSPSRTWFWLQQSLIKRPLESPYDNRMRVLVLQENPTARQIVRDLLQKASNQRRIEVLNAIYYTAAPPFPTESQARWFTGDQVFPRAAVSTFDELRNDLASLTALTDEPVIKQAAQKAVEAISALKENKPKT